MSRLVGGDCVRRSPRPAGEYGRLVVYFLAFGVPLLAIAAVALWVDHRDKGRGRRSGTWDMQNEAFHSRMDIESYDNPMIQGGTQDWATYRHRDRARNHGKRQ